MILVRVLVLCIAVLVTNGCTVLGLAADLAFESVIDDEKSRDTFERNSIKPSFTEEGIKQDIKFVKKLMAKLPENQQQPISKEVKRTQIFACSHVVDNKQQCFPPEYYKDMYIAQSGDHETETVSAKD
jgi:hypothetical protein